jgi:diadenosine tetraphosphatase ApaH/serine/threonine PP2A family protein phosphatase
MIPPPRLSPFELPLEEGRYLINVGAVGQPRDGDSRAAFGFYDTDTRTVTLARAPYDVAAAQQKIIAAGLPDVLAQRLALGR